MWWRIRKARNFGLVLRWGREWIYWVLAAQKERVIRNKASEKESKYCCRRKFRKRIGRAEERMVTEQRWA